MRTEFSSGATAGWWGFKVRFHALSINSFASLSSDTRLVVSGLENGCRTRWLRIIILYTRVE